MTKDDLKAKIIDLIYQDEGALSDGYEWYSNNPEEVLSNIATKILASIEIYTKEKCREQRELCAQHAEADININSGAVQEALTFSDNEFENPIEVYVINSSILDAPAPNF